MALARNALTPEALVMMDTIAREGSFAAAARELGKVPSALTYSVRQLEESLDVLLFDRSSRQAQLTAAGAELLHEGRRLLSEMDAVANRVRRVASGWETQLAISVEDVLATPVVLDLAQAFYELRSNPSAAAQASSKASSNASTPVSPLTPEAAASAPATRLRLRTDVLAGTWEALVSGQVDLAIGVAGDVANPGGFELQALGDMPFIFCVAPQHPLVAHSAPLADAQLVHHRAVAVADSAQRLAPMTVNLLPGQDVLTVPSMRIKLDALLRGLGCGFVPEPLARPYVASGQLRALATARAAMVARLHYAWRAERGAAGLGRALAWWLAQLASPHTRAALLQQAPG
jgi:DNA-binding transcriptional LysR family regulator